MSSYNKLQIVWEMKGEKNEFTVLQNTAEVRRWQLFLSFAAFY